jgi:hypothetical protein
LATSGLFHYKGKERVRFEHKLSDNFIARIDTTENVNIQIDSKLNFLHQVDHIDFQIIRYFGLIRNVMTSFSYPNSPLTLCFTLVKSKLEYASVVWNSVTSPDGNTLKGIQPNFFPSPFFQNNLKPDCANILDHFKFFTFYAKRRHQDALFLINIWSDLKTFPSLL